MKQHLLGILIAHFCLCCCPLWVKRSVVAVGRLMTKMENAVFLLLLLLLNATGDIGATAPFGSTNTLQTRMLEEGKMRAILSKFYEATTGNQWITDTNWNTNTPIEEWYGIKLVDDEYWKVDLSYNNLQGTLPNSFFDLGISLGSLKLSGNPGLTGSIPNQISNLQNLRVLDMSSCSFEGGLPTELGLLNSLLTLNMRDNLYLKGTIPYQIGNLDVNLRSLDIAGCSLTGYLPVSINNLENLKILNASNNRLSGTLLNFDFVSDDLGYFIDLSNNQISGSIPPTFLKNENQFEITVDLSNNLLTGTIPSALTHVDRLEISLKNNRIVGIPDVLCDMKNWNDGDVGKYGCDGILCMPGEYSPEEGRRTDLGGPCAACSELDVSSVRFASYYGRTACGDSFDPGSDELNFAGNSEPSESPTVVEASASAGAGKLQSHSTANVLVWLVALALVWRWV